MVRKKKIEGHKITNTGKKGYITLPSDQVKRVLGLDADEMANVIEMTEEGALVIFPHSPEVTVTNQLADLAQGIYDRFGVHESAADEPKALPEDSGQD